MIRAPPVKNGTSFRCIWLWISIGFNCWNLLCTHSLLQSRINPIILYPVFGWVIRSLKVHIRHSASTTKNDTFLKIYLADLSPFSSNIPQSMVVHSLTNGPITYAKQIRNLLFYNLQYVAFDIPKGKEIAGRPITTWPGTNGARRSTIAKRLAVTTLLISSVSILPRFPELNCSQLSQPIHQWTYHTSEGRH